MRKMTLQNSRDRIRNTTDLDNGGDSQLAASSFREVVILDVQIVQFLEESQLHLRHAVKQFDQIHQVIGKRLFETKTKQ